MSDPVIDINGQVPSIVPDGFSGLLAGRRIIFFCGPPRSGKDTAARLAQVLLRNAEIHKFSTPVKRGTHVSVGLYDIDDDHFEDVKDTPQEVFGGMTPRQAYIAFSENFLKPMFGEDICARIMMRSIRASAADTILISDSGFLSEGAPVASAAGIGNCLMVHMHREGRDFSSDSMSYWSLPGLKTVNIFNPAPAGSVRPSDLTALSAVLDSEAVLDFAHRERAETSPEPNPDIKPIMAI